MQCGVLATLCLGLCAVSTTPIASSGCHGQPDCDSEDAYLLCQSPERSDGAYGGHGNPYCFCSNGLPRACSEACSSRSDAVCQQVCSGYLVCTATSHRSPAATGAALDDSSPTSSRGVTLTIQQWSEHVKHMTAQYWWLTAISFVLLVMLIYGIFALFRRCTGRWPCALCVCEQQSEKSSQSAAKNTLLVNQQ